MQEQRDLMQHELQKQQEQQDAQDKRQKIKVHFFKN
jgi:hypothetical protein